MRFTQVVGVYAVVSGNRTMDAKGYRMSFTRQIRIAQRPFFSFNSRFSNIGYFCHHVLPNYIRCAILPKVTESIEDQNVARSSNGRHNVLVSGGLVLHF